MKSLSPLTLPKPSQHEHKPDHKPHPLLVKGEAPNAPRCVYRPLALASYYTFLWPKVCSRWCSVGRQDWWQTSISNEHGFCHLILVRIQWGGNSYLVWDPPLARVGTQAANSHDSKHHTVPKMPKEKLLAHIKTHCPSMPLITLLYLTPPLP